MRKIFRLLSILFLLSTATQAQNKNSFFKNFEIGAELGVNNNGLTIRDPGNNMESPKIASSGIGGLKVRKYIDQKFFVEAAFLWKGNAFGFRFKQQANNGSWSVNGSQVFMIPLRAGYELKLSKRTSLNLIAGVVPSFITLHNSPYGTGLLNPENISFKYKMRNEYKKNYLAVQPGISLSHLIKKRIRLSAGVNYYFGLSDVELYDVGYSINNGPSVEAVIANRGNFLNYSLGLSYKFDLRKK